jgi:hypothetical protein
MQPRMASRPLIEQLWVIRTQSSSLQGGSRYFIPSEALLEILTHDSIRGIISSIDKFREDERQLLVTLVRERFPTVFAILLYNGHEGYLPDFLYRLEYDTRLPVSNTDLNFLPADIGDRFVENQWEFIPVVLEKGALHRELRFNDILPFLEDTRIGGGGFGEVFKVKLHPRCQHLVDKPDQQVSKTHHPSIRKPSRITAINSERMPSTSFGSRSALPWSQSTNVRSWK